MEVSIDCSVAVADRIRISALELLRVQASCTRRPGDQPIFDFQVCVGRAEHGLVLPDVVAHQLRDCCRPERHRQLDSQLDTDTLRDVRSGMARVTGAKLSDPFVFPRGSEQALLMPMPGAERPSSTGSAV